MTASVARHCQVLAVLFAVSIPVHAQVAWFDSLRQLVSESLIIASHKGNPNIPARDDGAAGLNIAFEEGKQPRFYIEEQRAGADWIQLGLTQHDDGWQHRGWDMLLWGFNHQSADASFPGGKEQIFGSAFFVEAAARSLLLAQQFGHPVHEELVPRTVAAARWIASHDMDRNPELVDDAQYGHRFWVYASALGEAAALTHDPELAAAATRFAARGLAVQDRSGVAPEHGGFDVGYQSAGIVYAGRYDAICQDAQQRARIMAFVRRGLAWFTNRVQPDGSVDATGSTRTLVEHDRTGRTKHVFYGLVVEAFGTGYALTHDEALRQTAERIIASEPFKHYYEPSH